MKAGLQGVGSAEFELTPPVIFALRQENGDVVLVSGEVLENGTLIETDMPLVQPVEDVVVDNTMAWRAFRHNTLYAWLPPVERTLTLEGACTDGSSKVSCVLDAGGVNRILAVVANGNITVSDIEFRAGATVSLPKNRSVTFEVQCTER
jgi:hypothetical protein